MQYLIENELLKLNYEKGKGAWTYNIQIPNTKHIVGKWGSIKVAGFIDDYKIDSINLFSINGQDKMISINKGIRNFIKKDAGDTVTVSLYLITGQSDISEKDILETLKDAGVFIRFNKLDNNEKTEIFSKIIEEKSLEKQTKMLLHLIDRLCVKK